MQTHENASQVAIIAMSCRFPGADDAAQFWGMLEKGGNAMVEIPTERTIQYDFGGIQCRYGSFLVHPYHFDNSLFGISDEEALAMDPQQRIMLELALELRNNAGLSGFDNRQVGVYVGANQRGYIEGVNAGYYRDQIRQLMIGSTEMQELPKGQRAALIARLEKICASPGIHQSSITGNITNMIACRISHEFNLFGPSLTIDTACSSSLVAIHLACVALQNRECDLAMAGGVNLNLTPSIFRFMEKAQVISASGRCIPFSADSDGILLGEGAGLLLLKRLDDAVSDGDRVLAVIRGSGINNDGRTIGVMAPSWKGQHRLLESVYSRNGYDKHKISYIEAHGTSTRIGDSLEIGVLMDFFSGSARKVSVGSVKSNIGHLLGASGIAGMIKTIMALQKKQLPPSLFNGRVNPKWNLTEKGFTIQDSLSTWHGVDGIWAAGVSAFGFGGTNAHIILEAPSHEWEKTARLPLPTHFNRKRFAYDLFPGVEKKEPASLPMYAIHWAETVLPEVEHAFNPDLWIRFHGWGNMDKEGGDTNHAAECIDVLDGHVYSRIDDHTYTLSHGNQDHIRWFFEGLHPAKTYGILYFPPENAGEDAEASIQEALFLKRLLANVQKTDRAAFFCITRNAYGVKVDEGMPLAMADQASSPHQRVMATISMTALLERTMLHGCVMDVGADFRIGQDIPGELLKISRGGPFVNRAGQYYIPDLRQPSTNGHGRIKPGGLYCILGGSSGIGAEVAMYLHDVHAVRVVVCGTRDASDLHQRMKTTDTGRFEYVVADVTRAADVTAFVDHTYAVYGVPDGIIFCAGTIRYGSVAGAADAGFEETLRTKIVGVENLAHALSGKKAGLVYLVSSVSGLAAGWAAGMPAYAAANAYLDACAERLSSPELPWLSGSWTLWKDTGMSKGIAHKGENSLMPLAADQALKLFEGSLSANSTHIVLIDPVDAGKFSDAWFLNNKPASVNDAAVNQELRIQSKPASSNDAAVKFQIKTQEEHQVETLAKTQSQTHEVSDYPEIRSFLLKLVAETIGADAGGIDEEESFSMLGLDSIGALDTVALIEQQYQVSLSPTLLFENDTIAKLSVYLAKLTRTENPLSEKLQMPVSMMKLSHTQRAFFINHHIFPNAPCNMQIRCDFDRRFDMDLLRRAWEVVAGRHESLRLSFMLSEEGIVQQLYATSEAQFTCIDLTDRADVTGEISLLEDTYLNKRYDIGQLPLYDLCYVVLPGSCAVILFNAHHIMTDAWSVAVLLRDLVSIYQALQEGTYNEENYVVASYTDYMAQLPATDGQGIQMATGTKATGKVVTGNLASGISIEPTHFKSFRLGIDGQMTEKISRSAGAYGLSLFDVLAAAYAHAIQAVTGKDDVTMRIAQANRNRQIAQVGSLTGCFADSAGLHLHITRGLSWHELARLVKTSVWESGRVAASAVPLNDISPFGMSYFNLDYFLKDFGDERLDVSSSVSLPFSDVSLICLKVHGALQISWNYPFNVIPEKMVHELSLCFTDFLTGISPSNESGNSQTMEAPDVNDHLTATSVTEIPGIHHVVMPSEILFEGNPLLHEKVFAACERYANRSCIDEGDQVFTYADVKAAAISIAGGIIQAGYDRDEAIGILAYPGAEAVTGILGILASGCAYIPLDPDWPPGRIADVIGHSGIRCLLCSSEHLENLRRSIARLSGLTQIFLLNGDSGGKDGSISDALFWDGCSISSIDMQQGLSLPDPARRPTSGSLAYIMYTSGTTGTPKGVMVTHRAVEIFLSWVAEAFCH
jgi:3-oxoacyl-(acyl-carrier-protein) synthase/acyl carrier protein